jgi:hypothetical protein
MMRIIPITGAIAAMETSVAKVVDVTTFCRPATD